MLMIRNIIFASLFLCAAFVALPAVAQDGRMVFVDLERVFDEFHKTKRAFEGLEQRAQENRAERDRRIARLQELQEQYQSAREISADTAMSEAVREEKRNEAIDLQLEIERYREQSEEVLMELAQAQQADEQRIQRRLVDEILERMERWGRQQGYLAVLDASGRAVTGVPLALYVDSRADMTDAFLEVLNAAR